MIEIYPTAIVEKKTKRARDLFQMRLRLLGVRLQCRITFVCRWVGAQRLGFPIQHKPVRICRAVSMQSNDFMRPKPVHRIEPRCNSAPLLGGGAIHGAFRWPKQSRFREGFGVFSESCHVFEKGLEVFCRRSVHARNFLALGFCAKYLDTASSSSGCKGVTLVRLDGEQIHPNQKAIRLMLTPIRQRGYKWFANIH